MTMRCHNLLRCLALAVLPCGLVVSFALSELTIPSRSPLTAQAVSWGILALVTSFRLGFRSRPVFDSDAWYLATPYIGFLVLSSISGVGNATQKFMGCLPLFILSNFYRPRFLELLATSSTESAHILSLVGPNLLIFIAFLSSNVLLLHSYCRSETAALALGGLGLLATSLHRLSTFLAEHGSLKLDIVGIAKEGSSLGHDSAPALRPSKQLNLYRNASISIALACFVSSFFVEGTLFSGASSTMNSFSTSDWRERLFIQELVALATHVGLETLKIICLYKTVSQYPLMISCLLLIGGSVLSSFINSAFSSTWLVAIYAISSVQYWAESSLDFGSPNTQNWQQRMKKLVILLVIIGLAATVTSGSVSISGSIASDEVKLPETGLLDIAVTADTILNTHPIQQLMTEAASDFKQIKNRQSKNLPDAVKEYKTRYGVNPPPGFDRWFEFAMEHKVSLIDEFDGIYQDMLPFWALEPRLIRSRVSEALGFDNGLLGILIRGGSVAHVSVSGKTMYEDSNSTATGIHEQTEALVGMLQSFVQHLPDMDLAFNLHDEPRVILQHSRLSKLVKVAQNVNMPAALAQPGPRNTFSARPEDMNDGSGIAEVRETRFNRFARQATWSHARLSCPPESPAQDVITDTPADDATSWAFGPLGFVKNITAMSDICQSPSLAHNHGFFQRPNVFNIAQDLLPIFSPSKFSSFSDILYPPSWYWAQRTPYDSAEDIPWDDKNSTLYWRGSTTGGFSRRGGWRKHHRQVAVRTLNANENTYVLNRAPSSSQGNDTSPWEPSLISRQTLSSHVNVSFTHIGQCDPSDCRAQKEFFHVQPAEPQSQAWQHRLLLDMDGNAFSGRFASFVSSNSAVVKLGVVREALVGDWIRPWVHYVPISMRGGEWAEVVKYLLSGKDKLATPKPDEGDSQGQESQEQELVVEEGDEAAHRIARDGAQWATRALRQVDMEAWMFRLLLEYGRIIDDSRNEIGYAPT